MIKRDNIEFILGVVLVLIPYSGLPSDIRSFLVIIIGAFFMYVALRELDKKRIGEEQNIKESENLQKQYEGSHIVETPKYNENIL
jgi:hypothetical protein